MGSYRQGFPQRVMTEHMTTGLALIEQSASRLSGRKAYLQEATCDTLPFVQDLGVQKIRYPITGRAYRHPIPMGHAWVGLNGLYSTTKSFKKTDKHWRSVTQFKAQYILNRSSIISINMWEKKIITLPFVTCWQLLDDRSRTHSVATTISYFVNDLQF